MQRIFPSFLSAFCGFAVLALAAMAAGPAQAAVCLRNFSPDALRVSMINVDTGIIDEERILETGWGQCFFQSSAGGEKRHHLMLSTRVDPNADPDQQAVWNELVAEARSILIRGQGIVPGGLNANRMPPQDFIPFKFFSWEPYTEYAYSVMLANRPEQLREFVLMPFVTAQADAPSERFPSGDIYELHRGILRATQRSKSAAACAATSISRASSAHTWLRFALPEGMAKQEIRIPGGARNKYVFPTCHRVVWGDHLYRCSNAGQWTLISGDAHADVLCHGGVPNSPYIQTGEK